MFHYLWVLTLFHQQYLQIWTSFDPILEQLQNEGLGMGHNITMLKNWSQK